MSWDAAPPPSRDRRASAALTGWVVGVTTGMCGPLAFAWAAEGFSAPGLLGVLCLLVAGALAATATFPLGLLAALAEERVRALRGGRWSPGRGAFAAAWLAGWLAAIGPTVALGFWLVTL
ncbi:hypothetical protein [Alienimonas californiensis]|uniref:Uncharacterized protein n=1 Tax=Alienimonas californiensis TaxID=2527989 RepID=A0A517P8H0_9PLAN|nr:hypothetical protein [Alienimonas californiensis]QDT15670.1 hypothetical protein CA12_17600 [Alienimonas californiensis]